MKRQHGQLEDSTEATAQFWSTFDEKVLGHVDVLRAQFARTVAGVVLQGAEVRPIRNGASGIVATSGGRCVGWSFHETAGAAATVYLRDGADANADVVAVLSLSAGESTRDSYMPSGLSFLNGLFVDQAVGDVEGAVYLGAVD